MLVLFTLLIFPLMVHSKDLHLVILMFCVQRNFSFVFHLKLLSCMDLRFMEENLIKTDFMYLKHELKRVTLFLCLLNIIK